MSSELIFFASPMVFFLSLLLSSLFILKKIGINIFGYKPILLKHYRFAKYSILFVWFAVFIQITGFNIRLFSIPSVMVKFSLILWMAGFFFMSTGILLLGQSMRIGLPKGATTLKTSGIFKFSRNPMYLGLNLTLVSSLIYSVNPIILLLVITTIYFHHAIILSEEKMLNERFGAQYTHYCTKVRRYI